MSDQVFARIDGYIVAVSEKGIGIGESKGSRASYWLPRSQVSTITYHDGDSFEIWPREFIESIEMPAWLAERHELVAMDD